MATSTYFPQYHSYGYPTALPVNPLYTGPVQAIQPVPMIVNPAAVLPTQLYPYLSQPLVIPVISPISASRCASPVPCYFESFSSEESHVGSFYGSDNGTKIEPGLENSMEYYLSLPKTLFPSARMIRADPNALIDEFCRLPNVYRNVAWILDLEFGIPKSPITRPIPIYNVKFNSIHCKNTPEAIHPGFESCGENFKRVFLFYYDSIVSVWYQMYVFLNSDRSVENFQAWLSLPMQALGMSWS